MMSALASNLPALLNLAIAQAAQRGDLDGAKALLHIAQPLRTTQMAVSNAYEGDFEMARARLDAMPATAAEFQERDVSYHREDNRRSSQIQLTEAQYKTLLEEQREIATTHRALLVPLRQLEAMSDTAFWGRTQLARTASNSLLADVILQHEYLRLMNIQFAIVRALGDIYLSAAGAGIPGHEAPEFWHWQSQSQELCLAPKGATVSFGGEQSVCLPDWMSYPTGLTR